MAGDDDKQEQIKEPLLSNSRFKHSARALADIVILDNHYKDEKQTEFPDRILSSAMIVEQFNGSKSIADSLYTDMMAGLNETAAQSEERKKIYGVNFFAPPQIKTIGELIMENFEDPINVILLIAGAVSMVINLIQEGWPKGIIEGVSIIISLLIIITVNSGNNYISEKRLADLVSLSDQQVVAVYKGNEKETTTMDAADLLVGDVFAFEPGMKVPADCILIDGQDVVCDEGELTGEPIGIAKEPVTSENYNSGVMATMLAKSLVQSGSGRALVLAVGPNSVAGVITEKTQTKDDGDDKQTRLQKQLGTIADKIGKVGIMCASLTFFAMLVRILLEFVDVIPCGCENITACNQSPSCVPLSFTGGRLWKMILDTIIIAIAIIVAAIPEGLPLAVTISLSFSSAQMMKLNNLVRKLSSSETMGGVTHICSDKTGTLTQNKMTVMAVQAVQKVFTTGVGDPDKFSKELADTVSKDMGFAFNDLYEGVMWNSSARLEQDSETKEYSTFGNVTEQGIIKFFMNVYGGQGCKDKQLEKIDENILCKIPFSSSRKRGSIVLRNPTKEGTNYEVRIYTKGAPDMLFPKVTKVLNASGKACNNDDSVDCPDTLKHVGNEDQTTYMGILEKTVKFFADQAFRTILVTYRDMSIGEFEQIKAQNNDFEKEIDREILEQGLTAVGIFGLIDPLRIGIIESILQCKNAGIRTIMCTGDNIDTAKAISKNAGILPEDVEIEEYTCMTGKQFREIVGGLTKVKLDNGTEKDAVKNMGKFRQVKEQLRVLGRSSPEDKYILVTGIQDCDGVVAVTGDGTNDAPALTKADVGFAMGITGTDIAKGACDIILLDDNFTSIVVALRYGRSVYDNVRKFLQFQLSVNVVAMFMCFFGTVILKDSPLNAVQLLWVNLVMDTLGALALATEPPTKDILERMPYKKTDKIISEQMWRNVFGHAIWQIILLSVILLCGQGVICEPYLLQCEKWTTPKGKTKAECETYNPFFSNALYILETEKKEWGKLTFDGKALTSANFNTKKLDVMRCYAYNKKEKLPRSTKCTAADLATMKTFLPGDLPLYSETEKVRHFTYVFNIFVFLQVFNIINSRKIVGELNVFADFFNNWLFLFVMILTMAVQILIIEIGQMATKTVALNVTDNFICIGLGFTSLIWGFILKFIPLSLFQCYSMDDDPQDEEDHGKSAVSKFKKARTNPEKKPPSVVQVENAMLNRFSNLKQFKKVDNE